MIGFEGWGRLAEVPAFARLLLAAPLEPDDLPEWSSAPPPRDVEP